MAQIRAVLSRLLDEPVLLSMAATALVTVAARYGLSLTVDQVLAVFAALATVFGLGARAVVTPLRKLSR